MIALLWAAALWLTPAALIALWLAADTYLAGRDDLALEPSAEWLAVLAAVEPEPEPEPEPSVTPIHDDLAVEYLRRELDDDELLRLFADGAS